MVMSPRGAGHRDPKSSLPLFDLAYAYVRIIERIERTHDPAALQELEEQRVIAHNRFADALRAQGIPYKDREHVTRIALRIAKSEL
jgi:type VI protein secretion system component VasF